MLETSLGDLIIDLETERCPRTCENFLKLCKMKYYALNAFFNGTSGIQLVVDIRVSNGGMKRERSMMGNVLEG
jgi:cyclophilin family peptidyl-prolyl cis-trans isomerase